jgi:hypothetical protein
MDWLSITLSDIYIHYVKKMGWIGYISAPPKIRANLTYVIVCSKGFVIPSETEFIIHFIQQNHTRIVPLSTITYQWSNKWNGPSQPKIKGIHPSKNSISTIIPTAWSKYWPQGTTLSFRPLLCLTAPKCPDSSQQLSTGSTADLRTIHPIITPNWPLARIAPDSS